ncbi:copper-binding protein [Salinimonas sp. HHU 13199]|uniref:Copper resistance protein D n=1 Tax=Salinimonas profundi TaxID=2729140 RepID=A0ABR8LQY4_9ALTE|nr:CopD family protein [Salinimonas profundi]MBD3587700.1 copper-binding protein [Salinimonas profundi]
MELILWNATIVVSKAIFYVGFASLVGCAFLMRQPAPKDDFYKDLLCQIVPVMVVSCIASAVWFIAKTGAFSESGLQGAFDPMMLEVMWASAVGDVALVRMLMSGLAIPALLLIFAKRVHVIAIRAILTVLIVYGLYSFTLIGHIAEKGLVDKLILASHIAVMGWWFGALLPLRLVCLRFPVEDTQKVMTDFGRIAGYLVTTLILLGIYMAITIFTSLDDLVQSEYGLTFLSKLLVVGLLLLIAARHRFILVPALQNTGDVAQLKRSINIEIVLACVLLLITSVLTSVVGPEFS